MIMMMYVVDKDTKEEGGCRFVFFFVFVLFFFQF